jgi:hypothetical protein
VSNTSNSNTNNTATSDTTSNNTTSSFLSNVTLNDLIIDYKAESSDGNIILFDIVGTLINSLKTLIPVIEQIAELISNYKINKAKV